MGGLQDTGGLRRDTSGVWRLRPSACRSRRLRATASVGPTAALGRPVRAFCRPLPVPLLALTAATHARPARREVCHTPTTMQTTHIMPGERGELRALGQAISRTRTQQNISTTDLACVLGVARQRLEAIEAGEEDLGYKLLRAIARALGVTSSVLLAQAEKLDRPPGS